ncbi:hypothetical protein VSF3289_01927 [Vibrio scophthalmi]|uniref:Uncharacterized protein n=1 Tax=Vibrio scophthalmi TaxID=45658 RepID=A0A1E3WPG0_9VIBR|nr:hypothetical protein VSF3289_01927 [Vibrio scophthalmi]
MFIQAEGEKIRLIDLFISPVLNGKLLRAIL